MDRSEISWDFLGLRQGQVAQDLARIPDPRKPERIQHQLVVVLVFGVLLFLTQCRSPREGNRPLTEPKSWETFQAAFPPWDSVPHRDTVANVLEKIPPGEVEAVLTDTIKALLHNRRFARWMVQQRYLIAIDGTLKWSDIVQHDPAMLQKHSPSGPTIYQVYGVEAVWVAPQGIAIPLLTEFCANAEEPSEETKPDSELKAFYRMAKRLRKLFPKLPRAILADGLFPNGPLFALLRAYRWDFMIVLQAGNLPTWQDDARRLHKLERHNTVETQWGDRCIRSGGSIMCPMTGTIRKPKSGKIPCSITCRVSRPGPMPTETTRAPGPGFLASPSRAAME